MLATVIFIEFEFRIVYENNNLHYPKFHLYVNMEWTPKFNCESQKIEVVVLELSYSSSVGVIKL